jgi:penicillin-binding protein 1A
MESFSESLKAFFVKMGIALKPIGDAILAVLVWPRNWKIILAYLTVGIAGAVVALSILASFIIHGFFGTMPSYQELRDIRNNTASEVYSQDSVLMGRYFLQNRVKADYREISPNVINALIATEDARFLKHGGIDYRALIRVLFKSIIMNDDSQGGGSTLSQQLAKNLYPRHPHRVATMLINKMKEMIVARRLELLYSKEELIGIFLNTVPFSDNVFGIKVASQRFFNKKPKDLKVEEAAVLIGMLKATTSYHPVKHPQEALERRNVVLQQMKKYKYLTDEEYETLSKKPLELEYTLDTHSEGLATYFREHVRLELENILKDYPKPDGTYYNAYTDGLKIYTTIDHDLQEYAEKAVREQMPKLQRRFDSQWTAKELPWTDEETFKKIIQSNSLYLKLKSEGYSVREIDEYLSKPFKTELFSWKEGSIEKELSRLDSIKYYLKILNTGLLSVDPKTGAVKAWVGGIDHQFVKYDHVKARRQVGSTFKPILYAQAVEQGMDPCRYFPNYVHTYPEYENWQPKNADNRYGGAYSLEGALTNSVNTVSVQIIMETGINPVREMAKKMGITTKIPYAPAIALGAVEVSLFDMVQAYSVFANRGVKQKVYFIDRIETADGKLIAQFGPKKNPQSTRVLSQRTADVMIKMMRSVANSGTAARVRWEYNITNDIAGKTGTSQNQSDGWFIGLTPDLVTGVWVGAGNPSVHFKSLDSGQGSSTALPIWGNYMKQIYNDGHHEVWRQAKFANLPDSVLAKLQCAHKIGYALDSLSADSLGVLPTDLDGGVKSDTTQSFNEQNQNLGALNPRQRKEQGKNQPEQETAWLQNSTALNRLKIQSIAR